MLLSELSNKSEQQERLFHAVECSMSVLLMWVYHRLDNFQSLHVAERRHGVLENYFEWTIIIKYASVYLQRMFGGYHLGPWYRLRCLSHHLDGKIEVRKVTTPTTPIMEMRIYYMDVKGI